MCTYFVFFLRDISENVFFTAITREPRRNYNRSRRDFTTN